VPEPELNEPEIGKPVYRLIIGSIARNQSLSDFRTCKKKVRRLSACLLKKRCRHWNR